MADSGLRLDSAWKKDERAQGGAVKVEGEVTWLGAQRIEAQWRWMVGMNVVAASGGLGLLSSAAARGRGMEWTEWEVSRPVRGEERRRGAIADAWRRSPAARRRYGVGAAQLCTGEALCTRLNQFDLSLTLQNSDFDIGT